MKITFWVVQTPTGDRPYVSINRPQSYIDHLDTSGDEATVHSVEVNLEDLKPGHSAECNMCGVYASKLTRLR